MNVRVEGMDEARTQMQAVKRVLLITTINKTNKNYLVGEKLTGLDWTQDIDDPTYGNEPTRNCKHKEIIKGANEEGNEGKQLGKIYQ